MCKEYDEGKDEACMEYEENRNRLGKAISKMNKVLENAHHKAALMQGTPFLLKLLSGRVEYDEETEEVMFCYEIYTTDRISLYGKGLQVFVDWESSLKYALDCSEPRLPEELCSETKQAVEEFRSAYVKFAGVND